jgi:transcriptional regulator with XRE-family HTH domain
MAPEQLKKWIADNEISQAEFASRLNSSVRGTRVDQSEVSRWLRRRRLPNSAERRGIEKITGISAASWDRVQTRDWSE